MESFLRAVALPIKSLGGAGEECPLLYFEGQGDLFVAFDDGLRLMLRCAFDPQLPETLEAPRGGQLEQGPDVDFRFLVEP